MLGSSSRPTKRNSKNDDKSPYRPALKDSFYKERSLEEICNGLLSPSYIHHSNESVEKSSIEQSIDSKLLRLNVGGTSFRILPETVMRRSSPGLLGQLALASHKTKVHLCTGYLEDTREYYFERSAQLFELVYQYYVTGVMHRPNNICLDVFASELTFWQVKRALFAECCLGDDQSVLDCNENSISCEKRFNNDQYGKLCCGKLRNRLWNFLEEPESSRSARVFGCLSLAAVIIATGILVAASVPDLQVRSNITEVLANNHTRVLEVADPHPALKYAEYVCMGWFTAEYLTKMAVAADRRAAFWHILSLIDLISLVPFYFELAIKMIGIEIRQLEELNGAFLMMRVLRVSRVIRIFKLGRYSSGLRAFARTLSASKKQLSMLGVVLLTGVMFFSTLVYNLEKDAPDTKFKSIPDAFWWCIVTMTTVGYGDMYPTTTFGKLVGSGAIACGVLVLALPITIIVDNFMKVHEEDLATELQAPVLPFVTRRLSMAVNRKQSCGLNVGQGLELRRSNSARNRC